MNTLSATTSQSLPPGPVARHGMPRAGRDATAVAPQLQPVLRSFHTSGGVLSADLLSGLMGDTTAQPISRLARWIVGRQIVTLQAGGPTLVPLFQFQPGFGSLQPDLAPVLAELVDVFDEIELATWFATQNGSLGGAAPADMLARDPVAVYQAARLDRFVTTGG